MTARAVVERMMVGCEAASGNPWWCRVHESRIRFHVNPPTGGANDCDNFRDALDLAEEVQEKVLADLREQVLMLEHDDSCSEIRQEAPCDCLRGSVLALIEEADRG